MGSGLAVAQKWVLPFRRNKRNYEDIGCMPYCLEHDRGFSGAKIYKVVRRLPDGGFVYIQTGHEGPIYSRINAVLICKGRYAEVVK